MYGRKVVKNMKLAIRRGVFETNSSSTHSVSVIGKNPEHDHTLTLSDLPELEELKVNDEYDKVEAGFGCFGWGPDCFNSIELKLSYALTMVAATECHNIKSSTDFFESEGFKMINDAIADRYHCKGVFINSDIKIGSYEYDDPKRTYYYINIDGYIDHSSGSDSYRSLQGFLDENCLTIEDFLFNKDVVVFISNDNRWPDDEYDEHFKNNINNLNVYYDYDEDSDGEYLEDDGEDQ